MTLPAHHKHHFPGCGHSGLHHTDPPATVPPPKEEVSVASFKRGSLVNADFGSGVVLAFVLDTGHEVKGKDGPEIKFKVQNPATGKGEDLGYREPEAGSDTGRTFWSL